MRCPRLLAASLVATVLLAACSSDGGDDTPPAAPLTAQDGVVAITGTDRLQWEPDQITADTGDLTVELTCEDGVNHNLVVDDEVVATCTPGDTATAELSLEPGEHRFVCNVPGHERTMQGTLTIG